VSAPQALPSTGGVMHPTLRYDQVVRTVADQLGRCLGGDWLVACHMTIAPPRMPALPATPPPKADVVVAERQMEHQHGTWQINPAHVRLVVGVEDPGNQHWHHQQAPSVWSALGVGHYLAVSTDGDDLLLDYHRLDANCTYRHISQGIWEISATTPWEFSLDLAGC
jgi:hypothetical protein